MRDRRTSRKTIGEKEYRIKEEAKYAASSSGRKKHQKGGIKRCPARKEQRL